MDTKALRQKILDLAIRGKLVPQDPNDEPASVLLERIREQKQQMVKEGKLKKKDIKNDSVIFVGEDNLHYEKFADGTVKCIEDEIPFEVPEGWEWTRLGNLCAAIQYGLSNSAEPEGSYKFLRITDIQNGMVNWDTVPFTRTSDPNTYLLKSGDIVFARTGATVGKSFLITETPYPSVYASYLIRIRLLGNLPSEYIYQFFDSACYWSQITDKSVGVGQPNCNGTSLKELLIPLPPINEQLRIIPTVQKLLEYVTEIDTEEKTLMSIITAVKSKILDLAIRGKLVPQDPDDEPASILLESIRAEKEELIKQGKIKRNKKESFVFKGEDNSYYEKIESVIRCINSEIPFKIPDGWAYERLGNICSVARGGSPRPIENYLTDDENGLNWIKIGDTEQGGKYIFSTKEKIRSDGLNKTRYVHCGDFLLTNSMSFGRPYILKTDGCIHDGWLVIGDVETVFNQDFLYYMLSSSAMYNALSILAAGSTVKNLKSDSVKSLIVPIPPLEEQQAIATQVETLLAIIAQVEKSLN